MQQLVPGSLPAAAGTRGDISADGATRFLDHALSRCQYHTAISAAFQLVLIVIDVTESLS
jgi:hypothetical protein